MKRKKRLYVVIILALVLIGFGLWHMNTTALAEHVYSRNVKSAYLAEEKNLDNPVILLGISGANTGLQDQCFPDRVTHVSAVYGCTYERVYAYNPKTVTPDELATYVANTPKLLQLLRSNGWTADNLTEYHYSGDYLSNVSYHKNIGAISCNLKVNVSDNFQGTALPSLKSKIYLNEFWCTKLVSVPDINPHNKVTSIGI